MDKKHTGALSEIKACAYLLEQGYEVFRNVSGHGVADLIAWKGDEVLKLDVKTASNKNLPSLTGDQVNQGVRLLMVHASGCYIVRR